MTEHFQFLPATLGPTSQSRLQQRRRLSIRDSDIFVSTAIAPTGWLAAATSSEIRLYDVENQDRAREIRPNVVLHPKLQPKNESIRAIAISDDLLAVVTHLRLIMYEYREAGSIDDNVLEDVCIDQKAAWFPQSVSILQVKSTDTFQSAAAWVAVGGEGVNGVKLFQYSRNSCWNALRNCRLTLKCPQNTGLMRLVGFSTFVRMNSFVVFGATSDNRIICWNVRSHEIGSPVILSRTEYDANAAQSTSPHRGEITAVRIFESPSGIAYVLCAVDQRPGSQLLRSFMAPLGTYKPQWRTLPDKVAGRHLLSAAASSNGRYLITVEEGAMKLLTLRAACEGGLTCDEHTLGWPSSLKDTAKGTFAISLCVKETTGCIEITGVDGRGHLVSARVSVLDMPVTTPPSLIRRPLEVAELPADPIVRELGGKEIRRSTRADSAVQSEWERVSEEIEVMLTV
ncbi:hypothetical protein N0V90_006047 [Kalmusia sp. IMI 367209]|nr:hypothetical protein N0V90_006047 [Kalmusia sp. IMI 367209]